MWRLLDVLLHRAGSPDAERSRKGGQTEALRDEVGAVLDQVDELAPPTHGRFAAYSTLRTQALLAEQRLRRE